MLAQNFKTAADLGISDKEFEALRKVLGMFERGEITPEHFDMGNWKCGTTYCIGGWAEKIAGESCQSFDKISRTFSVRERHPELVGLDRLFFPKARYGDGGAYDATPEQGAFALRNYLTHGEPRWAEALAS